MKALKNKDQDLRSMFRIITNSRLFGVEELVQHRFLWWTWQKWERVGGYYGIDLEWYDWTCNTQTEAKLFIKNLIKNIQVTQHGWQPVDNPKE